MKKVYLQILLIQCLLMMGAGMSFAQQVKNIIVMIPDG